jgi:hypothetical protein
MKKQCLAPDWPTIMPTRAEAQLLAEVRQIVAATVGIAIGYSDPDAILDRYAQLMEIQMQKQAQARPRERGCLMMNECGKKLVAHGKAHPCRAFPRFTVFCRFLPSDSFVCWVYFTLCSDYLLCEGENR